MCKIWYGGAACALLVLSLFLLYPGCNLEGGGKAPASSNEAVLSVIPTTLDFTGSVDELSTAVLSFEINNIGSGELWWMITDNCVFAQCDKDNGIVTDEPCTVTVSLEKVDECTSGTMNIDSNGGDCALTVSVRIFEYLRGTVTDEETDEPIVGVAVTAGTESSYGPVFTDLEGIYGVWVRKGDLLPIRAEIGGYLVHVFDDPNYKFPLAINPPGYIYDIQLTPE